MWGLFTLIVDFFVVTGLLLLEFGGLQERIFDFVNNLLGNPIVL